jgi:hypothetical protein
MGNNVEVNDAGPGGLYSPGNRVVLDTINEDLTCGE